MNDIKKNPFFSVVMVNFNGGEYLEAAIKSIVNQSCIDYELIIIDGKSSDESLNIIKKYNDKISFWVSEEDSGQSNAFNKGFSKAKGEYLFWLNADDILLPGSLKAAKAKIEANKNYKWFAGNTIFFNREGKIKKCSVGGAWRDFLYKSAPINVYGPTSIFHRDLFFEAKGFDESLFYTMDSDLWMRFNNKGYKFLRLNYFLWGFRMHEDSKTTHAFSGSANPKFTKEREYIQNKNKHFHSVAGYRIQRFYKILSGVYVKSLFYTFKYKNSCIEDVKQ